MLMEGQFINKIVIVSFLLLGSLFAQNVQDQKTGGDQSALVEPTSLAKEAKTDILGFGAFKLGSNYDEIDKLFSNPPYQFLLRHKGDEVEPLLSSIATYKNDFFDNFYLQFDNDKRLFFIKIQVNPNNWSFNEIYTFLKTKYGMPQNISFETIKWTKGQKTLTLSRKGEIRYLAEDLLKKKLEVPKEVKPDKDKQTAPKQETSSNLPNSADVKSGIENIHSYKEIMNLY